MTKTKSLHEQDLDKAKVLFSQVGEFLHGSQIRDLWELASKKKEILLKGEENITLGFNTHNYIQPLELVSLANRFYLTHEFGGVFCLIVFKKSSENLVKLSTLINELRGHFLWVVSDCINSSGLKLRNDWRFDEKDGYDGFLDFKESFEKKPGYTYQIELSDHNQVQRLEEIIGDWAHEERFLLNWTRKNNEEMFAEQSRFKKEHLKQMRKAIHEFSEIFESKTDEEMDAFDQDKEFIKFIESKGLIYP